MKIVFAVIIATIVMSCNQNKITDRNQLSLISNDYLIGMAQAQYKTVLQQSKVITSGRDVESVKNIGRRIVDFVNRYYKQKGIEMALKDYDWEYNLLESKEVNAWCMPGGKIAVYSGLLPIAKNNNALAVVMGHEIAHALAEHGKERMNQQLLTQTGALTIQVLMIQKPQLTKDIYLQAFGVASELGVMLPFSRKQELEADKLGLMFAAGAGYDPREAIPLWQRMGALNNGSNTPAFVSTHPAEETRIKALQQLMPEAIALYEATIKKK